jgi:hypothetical protein
MTSEIQVLPWDRHKHVAGLNLLNGIPPSLLIILTESMVISKLDTLKPLMNVK